MLSVAGRQRCAEIRNHYLQALTNYVHMHRTKPGYCGIQSQVPPTCIDSEGRDKLLDSAISCLAVLTSLRLHTRYRDAAGLYHPKLCGRLVQAPQVWSFLSIAIP